MGSLVAGRELLAVACGLKFPDQVLNLGSLHWALSLSHSMGKSSPSTENSQVDEFLVTMDVEETFVNGIGEVFQMLLQGGKSHQLCARV